MSINIKIICLINIITTINGSQTVGSLSRKKRLQTIQRGQSWINIQEGSID
jgi:hypothetical protein